MKTIQGFRLALLMLLIAALFTCTSVASTAVRVMTYNVDEGTDFSAMVGVLTNPNATTTELQDAISQTIAEVVSSNPEVRMQLIAQEIAAAQPDIVGLQEAALWKSPASIS